MHKLIEKYFPRIMPDSGSHTYTEFAYQFSDNCVSTVQPNISPTIFISSGQLYLSLQKERKTIHLKAREVSSRECNTMLKSLYTILEYGKFFLYLNNGAILGTDLLAN